MRPTPNELIAGIRGLLRDSVGSQLHDPAAVADLKKVMSVLRDLDWNEAGFALLAENRELVCLLDEIRGWISGLPSGPSIFVALLREMPACTEKPEARTFAEAMDVNLTCRSLLGGFVDLISKEAEGVAPVAERQEWRRRIAVVLSGLLAGADAGTRRRQP
jgi:hypothetical protein